MCGIVGVARANGGLDHGRLIPMREAIRHRGPDDAGVWWSPDGRVGLANRRLAIIDLSPTGRQPMSGAGGQVWITFNGEIYNYRELRDELESRGHHFRTASDTEVILESYRAWGTACPSRLNGMFAFALFDGTARRLFLARDRAGEKPLFYSYRAGELRFASELKALMADPDFSRRLDVHALDYYLAYGYVPGEMCILEGVSKLPPGHAMTYDLDTDAVRVWRYWDLPAPPAEIDMSVEVLEAELEALLEDAVRRQLVADVPVGVLLSGGLDSSLVTAMAARGSTAPVKTFTVTFPGHRALDEGPYARLVARHFGTQHTELVAEPTSVEVLPALARQYDEPMADSSMVPTFLISRLVREHVTVALGGDGGDELFGGYLHYRYLLGQQRVRRLVPPLVRSLLGAAAARALPVGTRGRHHLIGLADGLARSIAHINLYFDDWSRRRLLAPISGNGQWPRAAPEVYRAALCEPEYPPLRQATEADFRTTMVDAYLVKIDRASMLTSLEVRAPWLDYRLIEFAFGRVPETLRATETERKVLPKRLARRLLPAALDLHRKQGFSMPLRSWFRGPWGAYIEAVLRDADPSLFNTRMIGHLITGHRWGFDNTARLFALTMFELWRREYRVTVP